MLGDIAPTYDFRMIVTVGEKENGVQKTNTYSVSIEKFAVFGGIKRTIDKWGMKGIGDADIMSEFYQAKHFKHLIVTREMDNLSTVFHRIYDRKLFFKFNLTVKALSPQSRFSQLQLATRKAQLVKPPSGLDGGSTLSIKYSDPQIIYGYEVRKGGYGEGTETVNEKL